ncbi:cyclophilin-like fold protein [Micromonospora sp. NPDC002717]|uniref:cyclophilin-like fold protein n=1 Tax=Micromonospora sp. NPDC002717 TaxID=3154424 RepID=UPI0033280D71
MSEIPIRIVIGDQTLEARLWDNPAAQSLLDQLPLTLDFSDYGRQEVLAEPPQPLTMEGMPAGESAPAGTIGYYAPSRALVLYYTDVGRFNGIARIGQVDGDVSILEGWSDSRPVTIERAD